LSLRLMRTACAFARFRMRQGGAALCRRSVDVAAVLSTRAPLDWDRIARWTRQIVAGDLADIAPLFTAHTAHAPVLVWSPMTTQLSAPLGVVNDYWCSLAVASAPPNRRDVDALQLRSALGYVMLVDVVDDGHDFCYRLYGSTIARVSGADLTGLHLSSHHASAYVTEF